MSRITPISDRHSPAAPSLTSAASSSAPPLSSRRRRLPSYGRFQCLSRRSPAVTSPSTPPPSSRPRRLPPLMPPFHPYRRFHSLSHRSLSRRTPVVPSLPSTPSSAPLHRRPPPLMPRFHPYSRFHLCRRGSSHRSLPLTPPLLMRVHGFRPPLDSPSYRRLPPADILQHRMCATLYFLFFPEQQYQGFAVNSVYWMFAMLSRDSLDEIIGRWTPAELLQFDEHKKQLVKFLRYTSCSTTNLGLDPSDEPSVPFSEWNTFAEDRVAALRYIGLSREDPPERIADILHRLVLEGEREINNLPEILSITVHDVRTAHLDVSEEEFKEYVEKLPTLAHPTNLKELILFAHYKQATVGPPPFDRPSLLEGSVRMQMRDLALWDVWKLIGEVKTKTEAMRDFVVMAKELLQESSP